MTEKPSKVQPALIGGMICGILSTIPILDYGNACCCLWAVLGGAISARSLISRSPVLPIKSGDGAMVGLLCGLVASAINLVLGTPLKLLMMRGNTASIEQIGVTSDPAVAELMKEVVTLMKEHTVVFVLLSWLIFSILSIGMATLGGVIGVAMFEKRKGPPYPVQPPPGYPPSGFPPGGGYAPPPPPAAPYGGGPTT